MTSETSAMPRGLRASVPLKITSSILSLRRVLVLCSPRTQRMASTTLLFPVPFGPTTAVTPFGNAIFASAKDLNPVSSKVFRYMPSLRGCFSNRPSASGSGGRGPCTTAIDENQRKILYAGVLNGAPTSYWGRADRREGKGFSGEIYDPECCESGWTVTSSLGNKNSTSSSITVNSSTSPAPNRFR